MMPYQTSTAQKFLSMLPSGTKDILEVGSDIPGQVATALAKRTGVRVIGLNPALDFPDLEHTEGEGDIPFFIRGDGRFLPFAGDSFDAVLSIATLEHVDGIKVFLAEVTRVLKPKGLFYTSFGPIWSSAKGHHVCAKAGCKEARFWKPGKNPIPDYAHLLMTSEKMRMYLRSGPCCEELIEPIIQWVYHRNAINRCHFEEYMEAFQESSLEIQSINLEGGGPNAGVLASLRSKYGDNRNFACSSITAVFRKPPQTGTIDSFMFKLSIRFRKGFKDFRFKCYTQLLKLLRRFKRYVLGS